MRQVEYGKKWEINSQEDYESALQSLEDSEFVAEMSDSYACTCAEKQEIEKQRLEIIEQAKEKGFHDKGFKNAWVVFYGGDGKELARYSIAGTFPGELEETIGLLAYEKGLEGKAIGYQVIKGRNEK